MAIGMEIAAVTRVQDYSSLKQNEDNKSILQQSVMSQQTEKNVKTKMQEVRNQDNADYYNRNFDSRDKGDNEYSGDGGKNRKKQPPKDQVIVNGHKSFDIKI